MQSGNESVNFGDGNSHGAADADDVDGALLNQFVEGRSSDAEHARRVRDSQQAFGWKCGLFRDVFG